MEQSILHTCFVLSNRKVPAFKGGLLSQLPKEIIGEDVGVVHLVVSEYQPDDQKPALSLSP
jgi:hypothetical protein